MGTLQTNIIPFHTFVQLNIQVRQKEEGVLRGEDAD
jgi:hypothetical protein